MQDQENVDLENDGQIPRLENTGPNYFACSIIPSNNNIIPNSV